MVPPIWSTNVRSSEEKGDPELTRNHHQNVDNDPEKQFNKNTHSELTSLILDYLNPQRALFYKLPSRSHVTVQIIISSTIELLKQAWFLHARKGSQTKGFSTN